MIGSVLVAVDLTASADRAVDRAALLPLARHARITLLHVVPRSLPASAQRRATRDAVKALDGYKHELTGRLAGRVRVSTEVTVGVPAATISKQASAAKAELIVMGRGHDRAVRDLVLGSTAERVLRRSKLPVLLVRTPARRPYHHPLLAIDFDAAAADVVRHAFALTPAAKARSVVHAYSMPYDRGAYPSLAHDDADEHRSHGRKQAYGALARVLAKVTLAEPEPVWSMKVVHGSPRTVIVKAARSVDCDLLALGTHARAGLAHAFLGSVAGDVMRDVSCDVLVVPPRAARKR